MTLENTETYTFKEFALEGWDEETGVSEVDWYNAVVAELLADQTHYEYPIVDLERYSDGLNRCWRLSSCSSARLLFKESSELV